MTAPTGDRAAISPETLELIYQHVRAVPRDQLHTGEAVDAKTVQALTAGAVVLGLSTVTALADVGVVVASLVLAALAAFAVLAALAVWQLWPSEYRVTDNADDLWERQWDQQRTDVLHALVDGIAEAYAFNHTRAERKARRLVQCLIALAVEVALVAAAAVAAALGG